VCSVVLSSLAAGATLAGSVAVGTYSELALFQPDRSSRALERRYTDEHSEFADLGDVRMHYRDEGPRDAPVLLPLHGTASSLHTWNEWGERLTSEFRLVRPDMPGFGLTGPREGQHTLEGIVESVAALCDELGLESVAVAGNSLGGGVAWRLAVERPDLVSRLVLVDPGGATLLSHIARHYRTFGTDLLTRYATPRMAVRMILRDAYGDTSKVTEGLVSRYYDLLLRSGNRRAVIELAGNYRDDHFPESPPIPETEGPVLPSTCDPSPSVLDGYDISDVDVPTLFQWGTEDTWLPESFGRDLAAQVEGSQFVTYDGVGHVPMEEAPEATAADAATFLSET
jgi:pimeloyl-ACP methyl ester carboxylesterase